MELFVRTALCDALRPVIGEYAEMGVSVVRSIDDLNQDPDQNLFISVTPTCRSTTLIILDAGRLPPDQHQHLLEQAKTALKPAWNGTSADRWDFGRITNAEVAELTREDGVFVRELSVSLTEVNALRQTLSEGKPLSEQERDKLALAIKLNMVSFNEALAAGLHGWGERTGMLDAPLFSVDDELRLPPRPK